MISIQDHFRAVKTAARSLVTTTDAQRSAVLVALATTLQDHIVSILEENQKDMATMHKDDPRYDRLELNAARITSLCDDLRKVAAMDSPIGKTLSDKTLPNGLQLQQVAVPLGVIGIIYEARPNVTIDVFSLCFKTGNACVLKGGKEAYHTNQIFFKLIQQTLIQHAITPDIIYMMPPEREAVHDLLNAVGLIDVCIPRGSQGLIDFVRSNARIPVIETGAGIVHTYFDISGDLAKGAAIIDNAKTRRVSVCNALDCVVIHQDRLNDLPALVAPMAAKQVELYADAQSYAVLQSTYPTELLHAATPEDFGKEFLSLKLAIKTVASAQDAITHIATHTSGHSEAIIASDSATIDNFLHNIDAAALYVNASTAFTDGGEFGMGAEIGISTQKLHARGPMALNVLTSYKWLVRGDGQIR
jgi:glutamate-5-semialdehyde dehydrogenase